MTVVLNYVDPYMSIIMADDRINWGPNQEFGYTDGSDKIIEIPNMGWASGAGYADFIDAFQKNISERNITTGADLSLAFEEAIKSETERMPEHKNHIEASACVASWFGMTEQGPTMRIGLLSYNHFGSDLARLENGNLRLLYPGDFQEDLKKVEVIEEKYETSFDDSTSYEEVLKIMLSMFKDISEESIYVSGNCNMGLYYIQQDGVYKSRISGEVNFLIEELENDNLFNHLEIVSKIG